MGEMMQEREEIDSRLRELEPRLIRVMVVACADSMRVVYEATASATSIGQLNGTIEVLWNECAGSTGTANLGEIINALEQLAEAGENDSNKKQYCAMLATSIVAYAAEYLLREDLQYAEWCSGAASDLCAQIDGLKNSGVTGSLKSARALLGELEREQLLFQKRVIDVLEHSGMDVHGARISVRAMSVDFQRSLRRTLERDAFHKT